MKKMFKDGGFLSEHGENVLKPFQHGLALTMISDEIQNMSESELRTLGAVFAKMVGDVISWRMQSKRNKVNELSKMTDEEFETYLSNKYGKDHILVSLTKEELDRCPRLTAEERKASLEEGIKAAQEYYNNIPSVNPSNLRIR